MHLSDTLGPHLCFVHAMLAQLLGNSDAAIRYYRAALALLQEGSELALSIESSLLGVQGLLEGVKEDHKRQQVVVDLAGRCKRTSSVAINAVGQLLAALADENLMMAKYVLCLYLFRHDLGYAIVIVADGNAGRRSERRTIYASNPTTISYEP